MDLGATEIVSVYSQGVWDVLRKAPESLFPKPREIGTRLDDDGVHIFEFGCLWEDGDHSRNACIWTMDLLNGLDKMINRCSQIPRWRGTEFLLNTKRVIIQALDQASDNYSWILRGASGELEKRDEKIIHCMNQVGFLSNIRGQYTRSLWDCNERLTLQLIKEENPWSEIGFDFNSWADFGLCDEFIDQMYYSSEPLDREHCILDAFDFDSNYLLDRLGEIKQQALDLDVWDDARDNWNEWIEARDKFLEYGNDFRYQLGIIKKLHKELYLLNSASHSTHLSAFAKRFISNMIVDHDVHFFVVPKLITEVDLVQSNWCPETSWSHLECSYSDGDTVNCLSNLAHLAITRRNANNLS